MTTSGWALRRISNPPVEPITLEDARAQCQIDADITAHDVLLAGNIRAARELAESYTKRTFVESTWRLSSSAFPSDCWWREAGVTLPMGPVMAIASVTYLDPSGVRQSIAADGYQLAQDEEPAMLYPPYSERWPWGRTDQGAVQIEYLAGYEGSGSPAGAENVPEVAKQAIRMLVAHWFANRENSGAANLQDIPYGFERLLDSIRIYP